MSMAKRKMQTGVDPHKVINDKQVRRTIQVLMDDGWDFVRLSSKHHPILRWPDSGTQITVPLTPSDHRALRNAVTTARRVSGVNHKMP